MTVNYEEGHPTTKGGKNRFPEWSPLDLEMQREAREAVMGIQLFPDLERELFVALGFGPGAVFMQQLVYWLGRQKYRHKPPSEAVIYKTYREWWEERGLARKQVEKARKQLVAKGLLEERHWWGNKLYYRVNWVKLAHALDLDFRMSPLRGVPDCPPLNGEFSASQDTQYQHENGVHADVRTSPEENVRGTFSIQEIKAEERDGASRRSDLHLFELFADLMVTAGMEVDDEDRRKLPSQLKATEKKLQGDETMFEVITRMVEVRKKRDYALPPSKALEDLRKGLKGNAAAPPSPPEVYEYLRRYDSNPYFKSLAFVAREWDFTREERPPWPVWSLLGNQDPERIDTWQGLQVVARRAVKEAAEEKAEQEA